MKTFKHESNMVYIVEDFLGKRFVARRSPLSSGHTLRIDSVNQSCTKLRKGCPHDRIITYHGIDVGGHSLGCECKGRWAYHYTALQSSNVRCPHDILRNVASMEDKYEIEK